jgi:N-dimethylarginine dimethylaminohydrolase
MKRFLMCEPKYFDVCYVINPWMEGNKGRVDKALARRQWDNLHRIVSERAEVSLIEPVAGLPDMVFTANAGLVHQNDAIVTSFLHAERQPEEQHFERFFSAQGYRVRHLPQGTIFEGAGDGLFDSQGRLWLGSGIRSDRLALSEISAVLDIETRGLELVDPHWYHLDTARCCKVRRSPMQKRSLRKVSRCSMSHSAQV